MIDIAIRVEAHADGFAEFPTAVLTNHHVAKCLNLRVNERFPSELEGVPAKLSDDEIEAIATYFSALSNSNTATLVFLASTDTPEEMNMADRACCWLHPHNAMDATVLRAFLLCNFGSSTVENHRIPGLKAL